MGKQPRQSYGHHPTVHSRSYILRLWCANEPRPAVWHASLEDPSTKERFGFANLEQLFAFLMELSEKERPTTTEEDR